MHVPRWLVPARKKKTGREMSGTVVGDFGVALFLKGGKETSRFILIEEDRPVR